MTPIKILLTGANGQLGSELQATCPANITLIPTDYEIRWTLPKRNR